MDISANVRLWAVFLSGVLVGGSGIYLSYFYFDRSAKNTNATYLAKWKIKNEVEKQVTKELNKKCEKYQIKFRDRNEDGRIDVKNHYEQEGVVEIMEDQNFDGIFETVTQLENGNKLWSEIDTNGDLSFDVEIKYQNDIPQVIVITNEKSGRYAKVKRLNMGKVVAENVDTNSDGVLDTAYDFDESEQVIATYSIEKNPDKRIDF